MRSKQKKGHLNKSRKVPLGLGDPTVNKTELSLKEPRFQREETENQQINKLPIR